MLPSAALLRHSSSHMHSSAGLRQWIWAAAVLNRVAALRQGCSSTLAAEVAQQQVLKSTCCCNSSSSSSSRSAHQQPYSMTACSQAASYQLQHCNTSFPLLVKLANSRQVHHPGHPSGWGLPAAYSIRLLSTSSNSSNSNNSNNSNNNSSNSNNSSKGAAETAMQRKARAEEHKQAHLRKQLQHEYKAVTIGKLVEVYSRPVSLLASGVLPNPIKTVKFLWQRFLSRTRTNAAVKTAQENIPGFDSATLQETIAAMYLRISQAQANYQLDLIRELVSKDQFRKLQLLMVQRQQGKWDKIQWSLEEPDKLPQNIRLVLGRVFKVHAEAPIEWIQLTFRISSKQRFAAYSTPPKGAKSEALQSLVAGDPDNLINVEDYWVFEHKTRRPVNKQRQHEPGARWRLVERLQL